MALSVDSNVSLLDNATSTGAGASTRMIGSGRCAVSAFGKTSSGSGSSNVNIEVSNSGTSWVTAGTITLSLGTTQVCDGFTFHAPWIYVRANVTSISGTGASVSSVISA